MDIEFHYYMTYLIAAKAGLDSDQAHTIAYSSQYIDDNDMVFEIDKGKIGSAFRNYISQTMNILKPKAKLMRIYPIFHFIPGDPTAKTTWRKDGRMHWLNTTPNSKNANEIMDRALESKDLCRIGVACHGYVDTWAHQNFTGYYGEFNAMSGLVSTLLPNIGHADALNNPDWTALVWRDNRLIEERVDNKARFLDAAEHLLAKLMKFADGNVTGDDCRREGENLRADLDQAIGGRDQDNSKSDVRIGRYKKLAADKPEYGNRQIEEYDEFKWFEEAINEEVRGLRDRSDFFLTRWDPWTDLYTWKDAGNFKNTHWYRFQEAIKVHQNETWEILNDKNLRGLDLKEL